MLDLEIIKQHCRIEPDESDEDALLETYSNAARRYVENYTDRALYETPEAAVLSADKDALALDDDITTAMLLLVGHWYANREGVVIGAITAEVPMAVEALLQPYRIYGL